MTLAAIVWFGFKLGWAAAVARQAWRRRYAAAYLTAAITAVCVFGFGVVFAAPAAAALLGCGASIAEHRQPTHRALLMSDTISDRHLIDELERGEALVTAARALRGCKVPPQIRCSLCEARGDEPCGAGLHG